MTIILLTLTIVGLIGNHLFFSKINRNFQELQDLQEEIVKELNLKNVVNSMPRGNNK